VLTLEMAQQDPHAPWVYTLGKMSFIRQSISVGMVDGVSAHSDNLRKEVRSVLFKSSWSLKDDLWEFNRISFSVGEISKN